MGYIIFRSDGSVVRHTSEENVKNPNKKEGQRSDCVNSGNVFAKEEGDVPVMRRVPHR